jgi:hypothetical protein
VKLPQLVLKSSVHVFPRARGLVGFLAPPSGFGAGAFAICVQPFAVAGAAAEVCVPLAAGMWAVLELLLDPHPETTTAMIRAVGARRRIGAAE